MDELPESDPAQPVGKLNLSQHERKTECAVHGEYNEKGYQIGKTIHWSNCPECTKDRQKKSAEAVVIEQQRQDQERLEKRLSRAGIPLRFRSKNFDNFIADTDGKEKVLSIAIQFAGDFAKHKTNGTVMVFSGLPGTGKSHLATSIGQAIMSTSTVLYISAIDAIRLVRDTWRKGSDKTESQVLDELANIDLLILDEVGVQYGKESEQITLFDIIDKRYRDMRPMILLTNQNKAGMKEFLGDRSFDRLREGGIWVTFDWPSERGNQA